MLPVNGGSLYNILPKEIRNIKGDSTETFKNNLDKYLEKIPHCQRANPLLPDSINPISNKNSNCIMDWVCFMGRKRDNYKGDSMFYVCNH